MTTNWRGNIGNSITGSAVSRQIISDDVIRFCPICIDDYRAIQNYFDNSKFEFFGHTIKSEWPCKFILQGIPKDVRTDETKNGLVNLGFSVHTVGQLKHFKTELPLPIFLVNFFPSPNFATIFATKDFSGFLIMVKTYHFMGFKQCYNCHKISSSNVKLKKSNS